MSAESEILVDGAMQFVSNLVRNFSPKLQAILRNREIRQTRYDRGEFPDFDPSTKEIRESEWKVAAIPEDLRDRRVEITGPPDRKMVINAMNSGANVFMADFEDSLCPTWENIIDGQKNLYDANRRTITYTHPTKGTYRLGEDPAVLFVRPRGLHLKEANFVVDAEPCPAALFDFGMYMWHNARWLVNNNRAPYFYLPKIEHWEEAQWWNAVFNWAQDSLDIPRGSIRATVLLETLPAAFYMNEILWELRQHSAGLNCGRWDYIFSYIKTFRNHADRITPDRSLISMKVPFMSSYSKAVIQTCHRRGIHAMGGMAAQIPIKNDDTANRRAISKVKKDKVREAKNGHDGTWVAHPGLVKVARDVFDKEMPKPNQIDKKTEYDTSGKELLAHPEGKITLAGLKQNIDVGVRYISAWLNGQGCVPLYNLMEDAATAEISRAQVWQWIKYSARLDNKKTVTHELIKKLMQPLVKEDPGLEEACDLFLDLCQNDNLVNFLTLPAYERINNAK